MQEAPPPLGRDFVLLQVIPALDAGGAERAALDITRAVAAAGGRTLIATSGGRLAPEAAALGATLKLGPFDSKSPVTMALNAMRIARMVRDYRVGIVHARSRAPAWSAYFATRQPRVPFVTTYHGIYNAGGPLKLYYNSVMVRSDAVIANSQWTARHVKQQYLSAASRITVIPRGIDVAYFSPESVSESRVSVVRATWGIDAPDRPLILMPERMTSWKGHEVLLKALARLTHRNFFVVLAGDAQGRDAYVQELTGLAGRLGLSAVTRIPGHCADMPAAYMAADLVVAPSVREEAFGRVAVEAQAMRRLVIGSALGAQTETIVDGVTGWLFPPGDDAALSLCIDRALALGSKDRERVVLAARAHVLNSYTLEGMCRQTLSVYRKLLKKNEA